MKQSLRLLGIAIIIGLMSACSGRQSKDENSSSDRSSSLVFNKSLSFLTSSGDTLSTIQVSVADEEDERNAGLMDVGTLPQDKGMLFIFEKQQELSFWMANTPLPLDIIFVNEQKEIVRIHHSTKPYSNENFTSGRPAIYAVETNGGYCVAHDIQEGMRVAFKE